jgi:two-component system OmpR family response regulator
METKTIIQDYYGATNFIELNKDREITIFIVDDNKVYLKLLKLALKRKNFTLYTFTTGEECLDYLELKPDLVILDYHLDGVNPYAQKGDKISELIIQKLPETETILISSDEKFHFMSNINFSNKVMFKDKSAFSKLEKNVTSILGKLKTKKNLNTRTKAYSITLTLLIVIPTVILYIILEFFNII